MFSDEAFLSANSRLPALPFPSHLVTLPKPASRHFAHTVPCTNLILMEKAANSKAIRSSTKKLPVLPLSFFFFFNIENLSIYFKAVEGSVFIIANLDELFLEVEP